MPDGPIMTSAFDALKASMAAEAPPKPADKKKSAAWWAMAAPVVGEAADIATTYANRNNPHIRETNGLWNADGASPDLGKMLAVKGGAAAAKALMVHFLGKHQPKAANVLGLGLGAMSGHQAVKNYQLGKKYDK